MGPNRPETDRKTKKDKFTAYYRIAYFFPIQDPHTTSIFVRDYITDAYRFIELGLLEGVTNGKIRDLPRRRDRS